MPFQPRSQFRAATMISNAENRVEVVIRMIIKSATMEVECLSPHLRVYSSCLLRPTACDSNNNIIHKAMPEIIRTARFRDTTHEIPTTTRDVSTCFIDLIRIKYLPLFTEATGTTTTIMIASIMMTVISRIIEGIQLMVFHINSSSSSNHISKSLTAAAIMQI